MHQDEEFTHERFIELMQGVIEPAIARHGGRIVKSTGDGFVAEFASPVEAVRCAVTFQDAIHRKNADRPAGTKIGRCRARQCQCAAKR